MPSDTCSLKNVIKDVMPIIVINVGIMDKIINNGFRFDVVYDSLMKSPKFQGIFSQAKTGKSNDTAVKYRTSGNEKFRNRECLEALKCYTKSIKFAENGSSYLGLAYANRSAVLFEKKYYKECLQDIERALKCEYPEELKYKLFNRRQAAEHLKLSQKPLGYYVTPSIKNKNSKIDAASDAVGIQTNEKFGRHIVATKDIKIGELIVIEKPYSCLVQPKVRLLHCHECLDLCYNMIPCKDCTTALYCSKDCRANAFRKYHKYECNFVDYFQKHSLLFLKMVLTGFQEELSTGNNEIDNMYCSNRFKEIKALSTNEDKRSILNCLLPSAAIACLALNCLKQSKDVYQNFDLEKNESLLKELLFKCVMIEQSNEYCISTNYKQQDEEEKKYIGEAIYSFASLFNHSCTPNCDYYFHGSSVAVRANSNIKKGSQCTISYGYSYFNVDIATRQKDLLDGYSFRCECRACINKWPSFDQLPYGKAIPMSIYCKAISIETSWPTNESLLKELLAEVYHCYNYLKHDEPCQSMYLLQEILNRIFSTTSNQLVPF